MKNNKNLDKEIAKAIHYPECWDTMGYPTLASALWEMVGWYGNIYEEPCPECGRKRGFLLFEDKEDNRRCPDCGGLIRIRNPTGKCDHLYYPEYKKEAGR